MASDNGEQNNDISDSDLLDVANEIGAKWNEVGIYLGMSSADLEHVQMNHPNDSKLRCYNMLSIWKRQQPKDTDIRNELAKGLRRADLVALAEKVDEGRAYL